MTVLVDTNVLLTYLIGREDQYSSESEEILRLCYEKRITMESVRYGLFYRTHSSAILSIRNNKH